MFQRSKLREVNVFRVILLIVFITVWGAISVNAQVNVYGYFSFNYEDVGEEPDGNNDPGEFSYPHLNLMMQSSLSDQFRIYVNLAGDGGGEVSVRNYWGEYVLRDYLKFRVGKIYRPFGLFNEKLDAVPTYLGIEPPELFDNDHLMLPRTGDFMVHGNFPFGENTLKYAFMVSNKEVIDTGKSFSWDFNYSVGNNITFGTSGYHSNESGSPVAVGSGSPSGGVLPWMNSDKYTVLGGYVQAKVSGFLVKTAYWTGDHEAVRDAQSIIDIDGMTTLNSAQRTRFGLNKYDQSADINDINTDGSYTVTTYYFRLGYSIPSGTIAGINWEIIPFAFWDFYENPETIGSKTYGGDSEAGLSDDGKFAKPTIGIAFKPLYNVAFKIDGSSHMYRWNGDDVHFEEIRFDMSYFFR